MRAKVTRQLFARRMGNRDQILDADRLLDLSADTFGYDSDTQALTRRIDSRRRTGRTASHDYHIIVLNRFFNRVINSLFINPILGFEFGKQFAEIATAYVNQFSVGKDRRDALHFHGLNFLLVDSAIYRFMCNLAVERRHDVQCLHYIRAVGTSQRYISGQLDRAVQGADTGTDAFIRYIFTLSVTIQDS